MSIASITALKRRALSPRRWRGASTRDYRLPRGCGRVSDRAADARQGRQTGVSCDARLTAASRDSGRPGLDWPRRPRPRRRRRSPIAQGSPDGLEPDAALPHDGVSAASGRNARQRVSLREPFRPPPICHRLRPSGSISAPNTRQRRLRQGREPFSDPGARRACLPVARRLQRGVSRGRARLLGRGRGG
jgi:hypothetical protein